MSPESSSRDVISDSFSSKLASILYETPADPDREVLEARIVDEFEKTLQGMTRKQIWKMHMYIDASIIPLLSGKNLLRVAQILESRAPTVIDGMANLKRHRDHLKRSAKLAEILSPRALERLIRALKGARQAEKGEGVES